MSGMSVRREAVFTEQSQGVEVHVDGAWRPGVILGWRHDSGGACEVRVRVTVAGVVHESWTDLAELRLPQSQVPASVGSRPGPVVPAASSTVSWTRAAARERLVAGVAGAGPGADGAAPTGAEPPRRRRRHGGDVTAEQSAVRADVTGRHRAPAVIGRHRAADDRVDEGESRPGAATAAMPAQRAELDCLTRPLRLGDRVPRPRIPRPDGSVRT
ncbi:hypothetical protein ACI784_14630 [Geodermatophilus sp. SYSU D01186]